MQKLPASIRVGYRVYRIEAWDPAEADVAGADGRCEHARAVIRVKALQLPQDMAATLLHEVLHACWSVGDLEKEVAEEKAVSVLSNQLSQVLRDNPKLVEFLREALA